MKCFKNYFGVLLCTLMMLPAVATADNKLSFEPFSIKAGETQTLTVDMVNDKEITLVQFDLRLPEGLSVPTYINEDEEEELDIKKTNRAHSTHTVSSNKNGNVYRVMIASQTNKLFKQNEGAVVTIKIAAASTFTTGTITMEGIELVSPDETAVNPDPVSLEITLPKVTVTINNAERNYGQDNPQFTYTASTNDDLTGKLTFSCEATQTSSVGEYTITGSSTATDLEVTFVNGKLTVTPAALTVTADAKSKEYGAADPELTYVATGLVNGDALTGALTRAEGENAGTYAISQGTLAASSNYTLTFKGANLTITPKNIASPTIELAETSFSYDGTAKEPAVTSVKDGTTEIPASEYTVGYSNNKNVGNATVTVTGKAGGNYAINASTNFAINKIPLTVKAVDTTREYGNDTPAFTVTYEGFVAGDTKDNAITTAPTITANATKTSPVGNNYVITVSGGAATNYELAGYTSATLTITKAPLTVTAKNVTRYVGQPNPTLELTYSGFKNGETESVLTTKPVATTTATADSPVGEYVIMVTGGEAQNYDITCVNGKLTVTEKPSITITAKSVSREYGIANPSLGYTVTGGTIEGTPQLTCEAVVGSPVGDYVIKVDKGSITTDANFTFTNGTLTITKAPLTVTAKDVSREAGEANPTFELIYSGFRNGDTESVLTTKPVATTTATEASAAGTYAITVSGGVAQNYSFTYVAGVLTVLPAKETFTDESGAGYEVEEDNSVAFTGVETTAAATACEIPATVEHDGTTYAVTTIAAEAFKDNTTIETVTIPQSVTSIGAAAFAGCSALKQLVVYATEPIALAAAAEAHAFAPASAAAAVFEGVNTEVCELYVPDASVDKYKAADGWNAFSKILPISTLGVGSPLIDGGKLSDVYDLRGRKITQKFDTLPAGIYIIDGKKVMK